MNEKARIKMLESAAAYSIVLGVHKKMVTKERKHINVQLSFSLYMIL